MIEKKVGCWPSVTVRWKNTDGDFTTLTLPIRAGYLPIPDVCSGEGGCHSEKIYFEERSDSLGLIGTFGVCETCGRSWYAGNFRSYK